ncbi:transposase [Patescibacteria group bacterium]|nr:transposase [Patescibacteria group bacterium]
MSYVKQGTGVSFSTLYSSLKENKTEDINWEKQGDNITLGIDEHSFRGKRMALTITNISQKKLLAIKKDDKIETVEKFLSQVDKKRISEVCIEMRIGFLNAVRRQLPDAKVTTDKFHLIAYANRVLEEERSIIVGKGYHIRRVLFKYIDSCFTFLIYFTTINLLLKLHTNIIRYPRIDKQVLGKMNSLSLI